MDDQQLPDTNAPSPPDGGVPPARPTSAWGAPAPAGEPVPVSLPSGPPSVWSAGSGGGQVPPGWSQAEPTYLATAGTPSRRPRRAAAIGAALALVVGGLATTAVVMKQQTPAAQPTAEAAVLRFLGAIEDRDLLGAAETLTPGERSLVVDLLADWRESGIDGVPTDGQLSSFDAYTLQLDDVTTVTQPVTDDIAVVELTSGRYTVSADATKLPFGIGDFAGQMVGDRDEDGEPDTTATTTGDLAESGDPLRLAAVQDDDGWHVSLFYTVAEAARLDAGLQAPDPAERIADKGAPTPEDAVRQMVDAGARGDWTRMIELTSPVELAVLHDYGQLILDDAPPAPAEPWFTVSEMTFDRHGARNATVLTLKTLAGRATLDGRTASMRAEMLSVGCYHVTAEMEGEDPVDWRGCAQDGFGQQESPDFTPEMREQLTKLQDMAEQIGGLATVEVDGQWYVSPVRTVGRMAPAAVLGLQMGMNAVQAMAPEPAFDGDLCFDDTDPSCEDPFAETTDPAAGTD